MYILIAKQIVKYYNYNSYIYNKIVFSNIKYMIKRSIEKKKIGLLYQILYFIW